MYFWWTDKMMHKVTNPSERIEEIKMTIWKGTLRHRRITTGIRCKNQGYGQETKSQYACICDLVFTKFYCLLLLFQILEWINFISDDLKLIHRERYKIRIPSIIHPHINRFFIRPLQQVFSRDTRRCLSDPILFCL